MKLKIAFEQLYVPVTEYDNGDISEPMTFTTSAYYDGRLCVYYNEKKISSKQLLRRDDSIQEIKRELQRATNITKVDENTFLIQCPSFYEGLKVVKNIGPVLSQHIYKLDISELSEIFDMDMTKNPDVHTVLYEHGDTVNTVLNDGLIALSRMPQEKFRSFVQKAITNNINSISANVISNINNTYKNSVVNYMTSFFNIIIEKINKNEQFDVDELLYYLSQINFQDIINISKTISIMSPVIKGIFVEYVLKKISTVEDIALQNYNMAIRYLMCGDEFLIDESIKKYRNNVMAIEHVIQYIIFVCTKMTLNPMIYLTKILDITSDIKVVNCINKTLIFYHLESADTKLKTLYVMIRRDIISDHINIVTISDDIICNAIKVSDMRFYIDIMIFKLMHENYDIKLKIKFINIIKKLGFRDDLKKCADKIKNELRDCCTDDSINDCVSCVFYGSLCCCLCMFIMPIIRCMHTKRVSCIYDNKHKNIVLHWKTLLKHINK